MARYTAWKTVIDGVVGRHRSESATYRWLNEKAPDLPEGTEIEVFVMEEHDGARWHPFERHVVRDGRLGDA